MRMTVRQMMWDLLIGCVLFYAIIMTGIAARRGDKITNLIEDQTELQQKVETAETRLRVSQNWVKGWQRRAKEENYAYRYLNDLPPYGTALVDRVNYQERQVIE